MLTGWNYWRKITIDHTKIDETLTDFPVTVQLTAANFDFDKAQTSGDDIRFTAANGITILPYERVSHDATAKTAEYHVRIPVVKTDTATVIYLYYGNEAASDGADPEEVWSNNYSAVWHMRDGADSLHISDSTENSHTGAKGDVVYPARAPIEAAGKIGKSQQFDGANDYINCGDVLNQTTNDFTVSAWAKTTSTRGGNENGIVYKRGTAAETGVGYSLNLPNGEARFQIASGTQYSAAQSAGAGINDGSWHHIVGRAKRGVNIQLFIDSTARAPVTSTWTTTIASTGVPLGIGAYNGAYHFFSGCLDEIRIASVARTNAWIKAEYNDGSNTLITVGAEETVGYTPAPSEETHVLVQIELKAETLYYADAHLSMSDGNFYEGRLSVSSLSRSFSSWTEPRQQQSTLTLTLDDFDGVIWESLNSATWGMRPVSVYVGRGRDLADYILDFEGIIKAPGGISYSGRKVTVKLRDVRDRDDVDLPPDQYWTTTYPKLKDGVSSKYIPIVYGDWSNTAIPATCIDTTASQLTFKIAGHAIKSLGTVYKTVDDVATAIASQYITNIDLTNATFRIAEAAGCTSSETITVKCTGKTNDAGALITNPVDILLDLQTDYIGIDTDDIDTATYTAVKNGMNVFEARRYIAEKSSADTLVEELAIECGFDILIADGKYTLRDRVPSRTFDTIYDETTVAADSLSVEFDPEGLYANRIKAEYNYDPVNDAYKGSYQADDTEEQTALGQVVSRTMQFNWLFAASDVETTVQIALKFYSPEMRSFSFTGLGQSLLEEIGNRVGLTIENFDGQPLTIRSISKNFKSRTCDISAYDMDRDIFPGRWTPDEEPYGDDAGIWTDDVTTVESHWW